MLQIIAFTSIWSGKFCKKKKQYSFFLKMEKNNTDDACYFRHLELSDDMKEYWGFYLLKGSTVTVSTCAR